MTERTSTTYSEARAERIRAIVDRAPEITDERRRQIAALLRTPEAPSRASRAA